MHRKKNVTISSIGARLLVQFNCESGVCGSSLSVPAPERTMTVANGASHEWKSREIRAHRRKVSCLSWSCDGKSLASGSQDGSIKLWKAEDCNNVRSRFVSEMSDAFEGPAVPQFPFPAHVMSRGFPTLQVRLSSEVSTSGESLTRLAFHPSSSDTMVSVSEHEHSVRYAGKKWICCAAPARSPAHAPPPTLADSGTCEVAPPR